MQQSHIDLTKASKSIASVALENSMAAKKNRKIQTKERMNHLLDCLGNVFYESTCLDIEENRYEEKLLRTDKCQDHIIILNVDVIHTYV